MSKDPYTFDRFGPSSWLWLLLAVFPGFILGQNEVETSDIWCDVLQFESEDQPYIEVHLEFNGNILVANLEEGGWRTRAVMEAVVLQGNSIITYGKSQVLGPLQSDSLAAISGTQFHLERLIVPSGNYQVQVSLKDANPVGLFESETYVPLQIPVFGAPRWSDPFVIEAFASADPTDHTMLTRSGMEMLPVVGARIGITAERLQFYAELYHVSEVTDSLFLVSCWLEENDQVIPSTSRYFRKDANPIVPIFTSLPLQNAQSSQTLTLVLRASTRDNQLITEKRLPIQRIQISTNQALSPESMMIPAYLSNFTDSTALFQHIRDHHPKADASQRRTIDVFLESASVDQMQAFLTHFWEEQAADNPELGWRTYTTAIAYVDSVYGACRNDHGADTDMGYIYLRYGPPNTIVKRHNETDYYPYEIWHYHRAGPFTNKRFLFFSPHMVAECFTLLHSDMLGEVQNNDWLHQLRNRENRLRVIDSQLNRLNPKRDTFSGEEPEDLFFNPR